MKVSLFNNYFIIFIPLLFSLTSEADIYYNHTSSDENLYFVFSTYRHGARTTYYNPDYFGNPNPNPTALTPYGALQHLQIGQRYRERYANFLNLSFDAKQMYVRSSDIERVLISTLKELEGLFGRVIGKEYVDVINAGHNFWNLFQLNDTEHQELDKYLNYCNNKKRRRLPNINQIFPILKECFGKNKAPNPAVFCDNVFSAYHDYAYGNDSENNIGKCGREKADKMFEFCINHSNGGRGWDEKAAYMFYILFQNLFKYMFNAIEGTSDLKMVMIGGHDITLAPFMDFLSGLKIVPRNIYPFYAFNIVFELRKYSDEFYIEIYYIDVLKYNETLETFKDTLDNSKYSNLYNMCGLPPWKEEIITIEDVQKETTKEIKDEILSTQRFENITTSELIHPTNIVEESSKTQKDFPPQNIDNTKNKEILSTQKLEIEESYKKAKLPELQDTIIKETNNKDELIENTSKIEDIHSTKKKEIEETKEKEEISDSQKIVIEETSEKEEISTTQQIEKQDTDEKEEIITSQKIEEETNEKEKISITKKIEEEETTEKEDITTTQKIEIQETTEKEENITSQKIEEEEETREKEEISTTQKIKEEETTEKGHVKYVKKIYLYNGRNSNRFKPNNLYQNYMQKDYFNSNNDLNLYENNDEFLYSNDTSFQNFDSYYMIDQNNKIYQTINLYNFSSENFSTIKLLGRGANGKIYLVSDMQTGQKFALKTMLIDNEFQLKTREDEYNLVYRLTYENPELKIVNIYGLEVRRIDKFNIFFNVLMEAAISDWEVEIISRKKRNKYYTEEELLYILTNLINTLSFLQQKKISHRDLKPQNILYFGNNEYKICDFGEAKYNGNKNEKNNNKETNLDFDDSNQTIRGTELYMSPILFKAVKYKPNSLTKYNSFKSDVFSLGLCLLHASSLDTNILYKIRQISDMTKIVNIVNNYLGRMYSQNFINLILHMLQIDENIRPDFIELNSWMLYGNN